MTVRPSATPQAAFSGACARISWSAASKSSRKLNAAMAMQTRLNTMASAPPSRRPKPPSVKKLAIRLPSISTTTPMVAPTIMRVKRGVTRMAANTPKVPSTAWAIRPLPPTPPKLTSVNMNDSAPRNRPSATA
ncbi:Uncharacterised protein [Mycobacteroides abscessus subsp. abscessus]|nr:Uncharacterised protein [Mycobacteroides abscessus subsp. abscessus]